MPAMRRSRRAIFGALAFGATVAIGLGLLLPIMNPVGYIVMLPGIALAVASLAYGSIVREMAWHRTAMKDERVAPKGKDDPMRPLTHPTTKRGKR